MHLQYQFRIAALGAMTALVLGFQNCAPSVNFEEDASLDDVQAFDVAGGPDDNNDDFSGNPGSTLPQKNDESPIDDEKKPTKPSPPIICDPLNDGKKGGCPTEEDEMDDKMHSGLRGKLRYFTKMDAPMFANDLKTANLDDYIEKGRDAGVLIHMGEINVPQRDWSSGFVVGNGNLVQTADGGPLFEWFSLDLSGYISSPLETNEDVQFALYSDDGSRLEIDDEVIVDNDGTHAAVWRCSQKGVRFSADTLKKIRLLYYQGPRYKIALQFYYRPWSKSGDACDGSGGWKIVPNSSLSTNTK